VYRGLVVHVTDSHNANAIINTLLKQMCRSKWLAVGQVGCYCGDLALGEWPLHVASACCFLVSWTLKWQVGNISSVESRMY